MRQLLFKLSGIVGFLIALSTFAPMASAATVSVCSSGCDFTTITDALTSGVSFGDVVTVGASYASTTESFSFNIPPGVTLDCQNSGAVIGVDLPNTAVHINTQGTNVVQNCIFSDVQLQNTNATSVSILDNTFRNLGNITIDNSTNTIVSGNTGLLSVDEDNSVGITISNNEFDSIAGWYFNAMFIGTATSVLITNNTIIDQTTSTSNNYALINLAGESDIVFATNTISMPNLVGANSGASVIVVTGDGVTVTGNTILTQGGGGTIALNLDAVAHPVTALVDHNTFVMGPTCINCTGILMTDWASNAVNVSSTYNLIVNQASSTANNVGHRSSTGVTPGLTLFQNYNGFSGPFDASHLVTTEFPVGSNSIARPYDELESADATTSNDFSLAPFSSFLDVNGPLDIGALSGVRGNSFQVTASGVIDYSLVDATDTTVLMSALRSGDTVHLANGTYSPIVLDLTIDPSARSSNMTIIGSGAGTIIHATSTGDAMSLLDIHDNAFSNFVLTGAMSTTTNSYTVTKAEYVFASQTYDESANLGGPADSSIIFTSALCNTGFVSADGMDVTAAAGSATDDWEGGLINVFGGVAHITVFLPSRFLIANGYTVDSAGMSNFIATKCGAANTVDQFIPSIFTANGDGTFSYNAGAVAGAAATLKGGETNPPRIDHHTAVNGYAGVVLNDANNNLFTNVTSTGNTYAVSFVGAATGNIFRDSIFAQSAGFDVLDSSSLDNTLSNTSFRSASSSITGNGAIDAFFKARAKIQDPLGNTISGANVTFQTANGSTSTVLTSDSNGFTGLTGVFPAFVLTSSTLAETSGGFNPFTASAAALSGFLAASTSTNLDTPNQLYTISMTTAPAQGGSGGGGGGLPTVQGNNTYAPLTSVSDSGDTGRLAVLKALNRVVHDLVKLPDDGNLNTQEDSAVYYVGADGRRHAFSNSKVYLSWYCDFSKVAIISASDLAQIPLGKNITYRPGLRLVKFPSIKTVYLVQSGAILRPITDEATAIALFGKDWAKQVSDISEAFYGDYTIDSAVNGSLSQLASLNVSPTYPSGNLNIQGYMDPGLVSGSSRCPATVSAPSSPAKVTSVWPFTDIPKLYIFSQYLDTNSASSVGVRYLQEILAYLGPTIYPEAKVTGNYGPATQAAVKRFQAKNGLAQTGSLGTETRAKLNALLRKLASGT